MMKTPFMVGVLAIVGGAIYAHGPINTDIVYNMPTDSAFDRVSGAELPFDFLAQYRPIRGAETHVTAVQNKSVTWHFTVAGKEQGSFTAELSPVDARRTKVSYRYDYPAGDAGELLGQPVLKQVGQTALEEKLDSTLANRRYNRAKVLAAVESYRTDHPEVDHETGWSPVVAQGKPLANGPGFAPAAPAPHAGPAKPRSPDAAPAAAQVRLVKSSSTGQPVASAPNPVTAVQAPVPSAARLPSELANQTTTGEPAQAPAAAQMASAAAVQSVPEVRKPWQRPHRDIAAYVRTGCRN